MRYLGPLLEFTPDGYPIDEGDLRFLSPLMRRHLGIYGQYTFDVQRYGAATTPETLAY